MKNGIAEQLEQCLLDNFPWAKEMEFSYDDDLFEKGIVDSLGFLTIIGFIEENFSITVHDEDIVPENFSTINSISDYVKQSSAKEAV